MNARITPAALAAWLSWCPVWAQTNSTPTANPIALPASNTPAAASPAAPGTAAVLNPFDQAALDAFVGRFAASEVQLRLKTEGRQLKGTLLFKGMRYTVDGAIKDGKLEAVFSDGKDAWAFSASVEGQQLAFTTESVTTLLQRQPAPKFEGTHSSERVTLTLAAKDGQYTGTIKFQGQAYPVTARLDLDELTGTFSGAAQQFPFTFGPEESALIFRTGAFTQRFPSGATGGSAATGTTAAAAASQATPANARGTNTLGMVFVPVPGTDVQFCIWETRVKDYRAYASAASGVDGEWQKPGFTQGEDHPVVEVNWNDAKAFCAWLSRKEGKTYRLPTDAEWSAAVGLRSESGSTPSQKDAKIKGVYPWGTQWPPPNDAGNYDDYSSSKISGFRDGYERTSPVGSFKPNAFGLYDLGGNVWEWCEDRYDGKQESRVLRGASWAWDINGPADLLSSRRFDFTPEFRYVFDGFRVVLVGGPAP